MDNSSPTKTVEDSYRRDAHGVIAPQLALVVVWSKVEPHRVGECLPLPRDFRGQEFLFGRGQGEGKDEALWLIPMQGRPGQSLPQSPLKGPGISRRQLAFQAQGEGDIRVENIGKSPLLVNGKEIESAVKLEVGDVLELKAQLLLLYVERPLRWKGAPMASALSYFAFGQADAWAFVGESPRMWRLRSEIQLAAATADHILLSGPEGSDFQGVVDAIQSMAAQKEQDTKRFRVYRWLNTATLEAEPIDLPGEPWPTPDGSNPSALPRPSKTIFIVLTARPNISHVNAPKARMNSGPTTPRGALSKRRTGAQEIDGEGDRADEFYPEIDARFDHHIRLPHLLEHREDIPLLLQYLAKGLAKKAPHILKRYHDETTGYYRLSPVFLTCILRCDRIDSIDNLRRVLFESLGDSPRDFLDLPLSLRAGHSPDPTANQDDMQLKRPTATDPSSKTSLSTAVLRGEGQLSRHEILIAASLSDTYRRVTTLLEAEGLKSSDAFE